MRRWSLSLKIPGCSVLTPLVTTCGGDVSPMSRSEVSDTHLAVVRDVELGCYPPPAYS